MMRSPFQYVSILKLSEMVNNSADTLLRYLSFSYLIVATTAQKAYVIATVFCGIAELRRDVLILIDR